MTSRATLALLGAEVRTLDPRRPRATAVAVGGDRILAVGDDAEIRALCDARTEVLDLAGAAVVPGLVDAHMHPLWAADLTEGADCTEVTSLPELGAALRAERNGSEAIARGWGVDYGVFAGAALDGRALEELAGGPALIAFFDLHTHLATPAVLARAGVDGPVALPDNGEVVCDGGVPTGELREFSAYERVARALPAATPAERVERMAGILRTLNAAGLTGAHVMDGTPATFEALRELEATDRLTMRLVVPLVVTAGTDAGEQDALVALRGERGRLWRGGVAKFFLDGVIETGTAWLEVPDTRGGGTRPVWPDPDEYAASVARFAGAGFQVATHAVGDRAVRAVLDAYRAAPSSPGVRHRIEHLETLGDETLARLAEEDVVASMQPVHMRWTRLDATDEWSVRLGPERAARGWRVGDIHASGACVALGSDWPVAPYDPRLGMAWARRRLSAIAALEGYTTGPARAVSEEDESGRIAPGMRADLTSLSQDPVDVPASELEGLAAGLTIVAGRIVHSK